MTLISDEKLSRYYAESLALLFFPGSKFPTDGSGGHPIVTINVTCNTDIPCGTVTITDETHTVSASYSPDKKTSERVSNDMLIRLAAGGAMLEAGQKFTGAKPPWGMITGVRPSKFASDLLLKGYSEKDAHDVIITDFLTSPIKAEMAVKTAVNERVYITPKAKNECSVYIAIPFCPTKCSYCSFTSFSSVKLLSMIPQYLDRLCVDICGIFDIIKKLALRVSTVYIGGGTPTVLDESQLDKLLSTVDNNIDTSSLDEFTVEAGRPDTVTAEKLSICKRYGVTRVSVNTQTLNDTILKSIGRGHTADDFFRAYEIAEKSGIRDINVDLIAGLPDESFESFAYSVDEIVKLDPTNITVHTFYVKRAATVLKEKSDVYRTNDLNTIKSVDYAENKLSEKGYIPYYLYRQKNTTSNLENVGFSKPGHEGLYNIYMMGEVHTVFGAGASAMTKLVAPYDSAVKIQRLCETKYPYEYLDITKNTAQKRYKELLDAAEEFYSKFR